MDSKPFWASKTIWVNFVAVAAAVASAFGLDIGPELQASVIATIMGVTNIVLRFVTKEPISV